MDKCCKILVNVNEFCKYKDELKNYMTQTIQLYPYRFLRPKMRHTNMPFYTRKNYYKFIANKPHDCDYVINGKHITDFGQLLNEFKRLSNKDSLGYKRYCAKVELFNSFLLIMFLINFGILNIVITDVWIW